MQEQVLPAELNEYQRKAVFNDSSACLVNANVGSGKTTVLTAKVKYLHEACGVNCEDMVVLTFTNKAAGEIRERLGAIRDQGELVQMRYLGPSTAWPSSFCAKGFRCSSWAIRRIFW